MENKVIYVPVSVQDELPENDEWVSFYINNENLWIGKRHDSRWMFFCSDGFRPVPESEPVTHWLKRIELPSEEKIKATLLPKAHEFFAHGFIDGANHILSIINQNK